MINNRVYIIYDFETGNTNAFKTQPLELAAIAICPRKLEVIPDSLFHSRICPLSDEEAIKKGLDPVEKQALDVNKLDLEELKNWPSEKIVWNSFCEYTYRWNIKRDSWNSLISVGFNIKDFDSKIINRLAESYGPYDKKKSWQKIFNPINCIDLKDTFFQLNENNPEIEFNNFDAIRNWLGKEKTGLEHSAREDVEDMAHVFCKTQKFLRYWSSKTQFKW